MSTLKPAVTDSDHIQGDPHAPVTLVEFGDYQCPSCGDAAKIVHKLQKHFGPRLRYVFRNFPLEMHPHAEPAAQAAEFAAAHGKFWQMHDLLYKHQTELTATNLASYAKQLDLSQAELKRALAGHTYAEKIDADLASGEASGLRGTPTFYLDGKQTSDSYDYDTLAEAVQTAIDKAAK